MVSRTPYVIIVRPPAKRELERLRAFDHRRIIKAMFASLTYDATVPSRDRKVLLDIVPGFEFDPPLWELKVGEFRVFYDVNEELHKVFIRAVRRKLPHNTTEEVTR